MQQEKPYTTVETINDTTIHYKDGMIHRADGQPAIVEFDPETNEVIRKEWLENGEYHRVDGASIETKWDETGYPDLGNQNGVFFHYKGVDVTQHLIDVFGDWSDILSDKEKLEREMKSFYASKIEDDTDKINQMSADEINKLAKTRDLTSAELSMIYDMSCVGELDTVDLSDEVKDSMNDNELSKVEISLNELIDQFPKVAEIFKSIEEEMDKGFMSIRDSGEAEDFMEWVCVYTSKEGKLDGWDRGYTSQIRMQFNEEMNRDGTYKAIERLVKDAINMVHERLSDEFNNKIVEFYEDSNTLVKSEKWMVNGSLHRDNDEPAVINYSRDKDGFGTQKVASMEWHNDGLLHREDGKPAVIRFSNAGNVADQSYFVSGVDVTGEVRAKAVERLAQEEKADQPKLNKPRM